MGCRASAGALRTGARWRLQSRACMHSRVLGAAGGGVIGADESRLLVRTGGRTERAQVSEGTGNGSSVCGHGVRAGGGVGKDVRPGRRLMRFAHLFSFVLRVLPPACPLACRVVSVLARVLCCRPVQAEKENIALGGPKFYSPGTCPADFKFLHYGVHILGKNP
jgi:hypothetical protein